MEADMIPLLRLLSIGPIDLSDLFHRGKPNFWNVNGLFYNLANLHHELKDGLDTIKDSLVRERIYKHGSAFVRKFTEAIREHIEKLNLL